MHGKGYGFIMYGYRKRGLIFGFLFVFCLSLLSCSTDEVSTDTAATEPEVASIIIGMDVMTVSEAKSLVRDLLAEEELYSEIVVTVPAGVYSPEDFRFDGKDCSENTKVTCTRKASGPKNIRCSPN